MSLSSMTIRAASIEDAEEILAIYAPYILETAITFEYDVPSIEEFRQRIADTLEKYPYIVAEDETGKIRGYAYVGEFHAREAYRYSVETSIYIEKDRRRSGLGRLLYDALEEELEKRGIQNLYACIAAPAAEDDPYLTNDSIRFHEHLGYELIGRFHSCGYKFNRWYDMVWMEKMIGEHDF